MGYPKDRHTLPLDALQAGSGIPNHNKHNFQNRHSQLVVFVCRQYIKGISNLSVFGTVTNVFTITGYSWFDPDVNAFGSDASRRGVDIFSYPSSRTYSIGFKLTL